MKSTSLGVSATVDCSKLDIELAVLEAWRLSFMYNLALSLFRNVSIHFRRLGWFDISKIDTGWWESKKELAGRYLLQSLHSVSPLHISMINNIFETA